MYDYVDGKVDWMAYGLPVEGDDGPFVGPIVRPVPTCRWDQTVAEVRSERPGAGSDQHEGHDHEGHDHGHEGHDDGHDHQGHDHRDGHEQDHGGHEHGNESHDHEGHDHEGHDHDHEGHEHSHARRRDLDQLAAVVLGPGDLAVGALYNDVVAAAAAGDLVLDVMSPVPATVRPSVTVASLMESNDPRALVTTSDGRLLGQVAAGDTEADEAGLDPEVAEILAAVRQRFGTNEPSEEQLRSFLHERLVAEGRTPADADQFLDELDEPDAD